MNVLDEKQMGEYNQSIQNIIKKFKITNDPVLLKGSASLKSHKYIGDFDLLSIITKDVEPKYLFNKLTNILKYVNDNNNLYFTEIKIQNNMGVKFRYYPGDKFEYDKFETQIKNIDFLKIDLVLYYENRFIELSIIYYFNNKEEDENEFIRTMYENIKELKQDKNYFKVLKKYFLIAKTKKDHNKLLQLVGIFNGHIGKLYQDKSNLEALELVNKYYKDDLTEKRILNNLRNLGLKANIQEIESKINDLSNIINDKVKNFI